MNLPTLKTGKLSQVAIIVKDIEETKKAWGAFLGQEVRPSQECGDFAVTKMEYMGQPNPEGNSKLAFFNLGGIQLELIEPNEGKSTWRDQLEQHGESLHHLGYNVDDIFEGMEEMKSAGYKLTQFGYYGDGNGAYAYFDCTEQLKCFIELLCSFKK